MQRAVRQIRALDHDVVGKDEAALEGVPDDAAAQEMAAILDVQLDARFVEARRLPPDIRHDLAKVVRACPRPGRAPDVAGVAHAARMRQGRIKVFALEVRISGKWGSSQGECRPR